MTRRLLPGVSIPYFFDAYGCDLAPNAFLGAGPREVDPMRIYQPLLEARALGFEAVRIFLCEGGEGILLDAAQISGVHPVLVESIAIIQECASLCGLRIYWTLLDAHSWRRNRDPLSGTILSEREYAARFAEHVAAPLSRRLDPRVTLAVEIVNEPDVLAAEGIEPDARRVEWDVLGAAIKLAADAVRAAHSSTLVTAGVRRDALPALWRSGAGLTAVDVHIDAGAPLPPRSKLMPELALSAPGDPPLPLIAGCTDSRSRSPSASAPNLLVDAAREGYDAAFLWRLEGEIIDTTTVQRSPTPLGYEVKATLVGAQRR